MLTTGFKIYISFALVGLVAMSLYGVASGDLNGDNYLGILDPAAIIGVLSFGWKGGVGDHVGYAVLLFFTVLTVVLDLSDRISRVSRNWDTLVLLHFQCS